MAVTAGLAAVLTSFALALPGPAHAAPSPDTLFGTAISSRPGETAQEALERRDRQYGRLGMVRHFYPGMVPADAWCSTCPMVRFGRPVAVSFKAEPAEVLSGEHDGRLTAFFGNAPADRAIWWTYYHEPEDNFETQASQRAYREAWRHVSGIADRAAGSKPNLRSTLILMSWSVNPKSGRNWRAWYPGNDVIDVFAWDSYNTSWDRNVYEPPDRMFGRSYAVSRLTGNGFAIGEWGSHHTKDGNRYTDEDGRRRAAWLAEAVAWLDGKAEFAAYWDHDCSGRFAGCGDRGGIGYELVKTSADTASAAAYRVATAKAADGAGVSGDRPAPGGTPSSPSSTTGDVSPAPTPSVQSSPAEERPEAVEAFPGPPNTLTVTDGGAPAPWWPAATAVFAAAVLLFVWRRRQLLRVAR